MIWPSNSLFFEHPDVYGISFDSRCVKKGDLFIALSGSNFDGHDFVESAFKNGAVCALVERPVCSGAVVVPSCLDAFVSIAKLRRDMFKGRVIAITGSVGKSTFRSSLVNILAKKYKVATPIKNYNSLIGLSHFFSQFDLDADFCVVEAGIEYPGEMKSLASLIEPDFSLLTTISSAHSYGLGKLKDILKEKSVLFEKTRLKAFFIDNMWQNHFLCSKLKDIGLAFEKALFALDSRDLIKNLSLVLLNSLGIDLPIEITEISGRRDVLNIQCEEGFFSVVDSSYNANLASMIDEFQYLNSFNTNKIVVLADMFGYGERYHNFLSVYCQKFSRCFLVGEKMKFLANELNNALWFKSVEALCLYFSKNLVLLCDSTILVKGSNCMGLKKIVDFFVSKSKNY